jgi:hypothetical protein
MYYLMNVLILGNDSVKLLLIGGTICTIKSNYVKKSNQYILI